MNCLHCGKELKNYQKKFCGNLCSKMGKFNPFYKKKHTKKLIKHFKKVHKNISDETRRKMSESAKIRAKKEGRIKIELMNKANLGKKRSKQTRERISKALSGKEKRKHHLFYCFRYLEKNSKIPKKREGITWEQRYGKEKADEIRKKVSESAKGRTISKEQRRKMSERLKGRGWQPKGYKPSDETKRKIGDANRGKKRSKKIIEQNKQSSINYWNSLSDKQKKEHISKITYKYEYPNGTENYCIELFKKHNIPLTFTGLGFYGTKKFTINNKLPDFVNLRKRIIVEISSKYFKNLSYGNYKTYIKQRTKVFQNWDIHFFTSREVYEHNFLDKINYIFEKQQQQGQQ